MRYAYAYKTPDGARHEASLEAPSREAAFEALRARGVRAIKVVAADGSKANGAPPRRRRAALLAGALAALAALAALGAGVAAYVGGARAAASAAPPGATAARPLPRQMIPGDRRRVEAAAASLADAAERLLAAFAEPGRTPPRGGGGRPADGAFVAALAAPTLVSPDELTESVDLKRIVAGLKREMRAYLDGGGTVGGYLAACEGRQRRESALRARAERRLAALLDGAAGPAYDYWLRANARLQSMGIYPLPLPERLREHQLSVGIDE